MYLLTRAEMQKADRLAIEKMGIPASLLMENAGRALALQAWRMISRRKGDQKSKKVIILCGGGNNGGDGFVAARHLHNMGVELQLFLLKAPAQLKGDALLNWSILEKMGLEGQLLADQEQLSLLKAALDKADLLIDAIFGIGIKKPIEGLAWPLIEAVNQSSCPVLACDIPSGLCCDQGLPLGIAMQAEETITFAYAKQGLFLGKSYQYAGKITVADISIPQEVEKELALSGYLLDRDFCRSHLQPRRVDGYKKDYGHVLLLAGSPAMPGAAMMAAQGILSMGAGLLTAALPAAVRSPFSVRLPEAMFLELPQTSDGLLAVDAAEKITQFPADTYLLGPGLGRKSQTMELVLQVNDLLTKPAVLDADALFAFANCPQRLAGQGQIRIITPHYGEMARLCQSNSQAVAANPLSMALDFAAEYQVIVVLKGAGTIIALPDGKYYLSKTGNPGMATGGSGDILAGIIVGLLAQGFDPALAAACGVWIHGRAGDLAANAKSRLSLLPEDIAAFLPYVHQEINANI